MIKTNKWMFNDSHDGSWCGDKFDSWEDAIEAGVQEFRSGVDEYGHTRECFYIGMIIDPCLAPVDFGCLIQDALEEEHWELGGEFFDGFTFKKEHINELGDEIQVAVEKWMKKHGYSPGYYLIRETERVELILEEH
ncbi:hypothetical protein SANA_01210 [Gottschalkiaceae bacterium SANA]|nr:hypothetical protein SANA_01210 [Gottschalkiaceae bacterium SANA]